MAWNRSLPGQWLEAGRGHIARTASKCVGAAAHSPLTPKWITVALCVFFLVFFAANRTHNAICESLFNFPCVPHWPISIVHLRVPPNFGYPSPLHILVALMSLTLLGLSLQVLPKANYRSWVILCVAFVLIMATTLTHGWQFGLVQAAAGRGNFTNDYYMDARWITSPLEFLRTFETLQPGFNIHSRTHPPGATLFYFYLFKFLEDPALVAITITATSTLLTIVIFTRILAVQHGSVTVGRVLFLYFLLPAVQIYYAATIDALIAPLMVGVFMWHITRSRWSPFVSLACLLSVSFLTFGFLFVFPVLLTLELSESRSIRRTFLLAGAVALFYMLFNKLFQFDYYNSFITAARIENPGGFQLIADPPDYVMTRLEDVGEVVFFLGPFLTSMFISVILGRRAGGTLMRFAILGLVSLGLVFLTGAYQTGETARAALFIFPFLMSGVGFAVADLDDQMYKRLAWLVFLQAVIMQLVGDYWW